MLPSIRSDRRRAVRARICRSSDARATESRAIEVAAKESAQVQACGASRAAASRTRESARARSTRSTRAPRLIDERARLARQVGHLEACRRALVDFYRPEREARCCGRRGAQSHRGGGALRDEEMLRLFREIMSACLAQEEPLKVALPGSRGHVHAVGGDTSTSAIRCARCRSLRSTKCSTKSRAGTADFGVVPIENSTRRHGQSHARPVPGLAAEDLRRSRAAHPSAPDGAHGRAGAASRASALIRSRWRSAAAG